MRSSAITVTSRQRRRTRDLSDARLQGVFHVEVRQFPHVARSFNLSERELNAKVLAPWSRGEVVELGERRWTPDKAKLTIFEAPELRTDEIGMGRGWGNVTRQGQEVTERLLAAVQAQATTVGVRPCSAIATSATSRKKRCSSVGARPGVSRK